MRKVDADEDVLTNVPYPVAKIDTQLSSWLQTIILFGSSTFTCLLSYFSAVFRDDH